MRRLCGGESGPVLNPERQGRGVSIRVADFDPYSMRAAIAEIEDSVGRMGACGQDSGRIGGYAGRFEDGIYGGKWVSWQKRKVLKKRTACQSCLIVYMAVDVDRIVIADPIHPKPDNRPVV